MRQKEILGSHFANAYEAWRANELMAEGKIRPVLWRAMGFDGVAEAHQLLKENKHLGKISIMVGATDEEEGKTRGRPRRDPRRGRRLGGRMAEVAVIDWHIHPFRADRWLEAWGPPPRARSRSARASGR